MKKSRRPIMFFDVFPNITMIDISEQMDDMMVGWNVVERTRWEGEGGAIYYPPWEPRLRWR